MNFFDPFFFYKKCRRCLIKRKSKGKNKSKNTINYEDSKVYFEGTSCNMSIKFSTVFKTLLMTIFYAPLIPLALPIGAVGVFLLYWVDKYNLLRRN